MDCDRFRQRVADFSAGRLDAATTAELAAHRDACPDCAALARRRGRPPRLVAAGFLGAFAASVFTLIYTGLSVREVPPGDADTAGRAAELERAPQAGEAAPIDPGTAADRDVEGEPGADAERAPARDER